MRKSILLAPLLSALLLSSCAYDDGLGSPPATSQRKVCIETVNCSATSGALIFEAAGDHANEYLEGPDASRYEYLTWYSARNELVLPVDGESACMNLKVEYLYSNLTASSALPGAPTVRLVLDAPARGRASTAVLTENILDPVSGDQNLVFTCSNPGGE